MSGSAWMRRQIEDLRRRRGRSGPELSIAKLIASTADHAKRTHKQLGELIEIWEESVPPELARRTSLTVLRGGVLHVSVDSSSIAFEIDRLLRGGLVDELRRRFRGTLVRVKVKLDGEDRKKGECRQSKAIAGGSKFAKR